MATEVCFVDAENGKDLSAWALEVVPRMGELVFLPEGWGVVVGISHMLSVPAENRHVSILLRMERRTNG